jgi:hypothetical protein
VTFSKSERVVTAKRASAGPISGRLSRASRELAEESLERVAVDWTRQALTLAGHLVEECSWPDSDPSVERYRQRRPDAVCLVDGTATVIEHTRFLTKRRARAWVRLAAPANQPIDLTRLYAVSGDRSAAEFDAFLDATIKKKRTQHAEWGRGILTVTHNWDQPPELLRDAIRRRAGDIPWWRVYWVERGPPAKLVWDSCERPPDIQ